MIKREKGFTLIEIMIVVVIVALLAAVAWPSYNSRLSRGRQSVAIAALQATRLAQENYKAKNKHYADSISALGINEYADADEEKSRYFLSIVHASENTFKARAVCNIDRDITMDVWEIDQLGKLDNTSNDAAN